MRLHPIIFSTRGEIGFIEFGTGDPILVYLFLPPIFFNERETV